MERMLDILLQMVDTMFWTQLDEDNDQSMGVMGKKSTAVQSTTAGRVASAGKPAFCP